MFDEVLLDVDVRIAVKRLDNLKIIYFQLLSPGVTRYHDHAIVSQSLFILSILVIFLLLSLLLLYFYILAITSCCICMSVMLVISRLN